MKDILTLLVAGSHRLALSFGRKPVMEGCGSGDGGI